MSRSRLLVIGYGNELRGDDAVGPLVARMVGEQGWPGVETLAVQQLTPELAERLNQAEQVIFVDARVGEGAGVWWEQLDGSGEAPRLGHTSDPGWLVELTDLVYGTRPAGWLLTIGARQLALGEVLSPQAREGAQAAVKQIEQMIQGTSVTRA
jgi:hydrogenase maturation protease